MWHHIFSSKNEQNNTPVARNGIKPLISFILSAFRKCLWLESVHIPFSRESPVMAKHLHFSGRDCGRKIKNGEVSRFLISRCWFPQPFLNTRNIDYLNVTSPLQWLNVFAPTILEIIHHHLDTVMNVLVMDLVRWAKSRELGLDLCTRSLKHRRAPGQTKPLQPAN